MDVQRNYPDWYRDPQPGDVLEECRIVEVKTRTTSGQVRFQTVTRGTGYTREVLGRPDGKVKFRDGQGRIRVLSLSTWQQWCQDYSAGIVRHRL